jgi:putative ABC transport system ATP-binding protein
LRIRGLAHRRDRAGRAFELELPSLSLDPGARLALLGENGSGKSTLMSLLGLAARPDSARRFTLLDADVVAIWQASDGARLERLRAGTISYLPQRDALLEFLTVRENIRCHGELSGHPRGDDDAEIVEALALGELLDARPAALSGGQRQRAAAACALARRPRLILADEPTAALDAENARRVIDALCGLAGRTGAALVFATHQVGQLAGRGFDGLRARLTRLPGGAATRFEPG